MVLFTKILPIRLEILMDEYTLYLDESHTGNYNKSTHRKDDPLFVIAGIIVKNEVHDTDLTKSINNLKNNIWNKCDNDSNYKEHILHELEMSYAITHKTKKLKFDYNKVFKNKHIYNLTYDIMSNIIEKSDLIIISTCVFEDELLRLHPTQSLNDILSICMNIIIENYYHYLCSVNGVGTICYESMPENQNEKIKKRYEIIRNTGTMFYPAKAINKRIKGIYFKQKTDNIIGLQIADFIPNSIGRHILNKIYNDKKQRNVPYPIIENKLYDGYIGKRNRFGVKIIP